MLETRDLPVQLTQEERARKGVALVQCHRKREALDAEAMRHRSRIKSQCDEIELESSRLAREIETGEELRPVECEGRVDDDQVYRVRRSDTGEVLETRAPTSVELQRDFPFGGGAEPPAPRTRQKRERAERAERAE